MGRGTLYRQCTLSTQSPREGGHWHETLSVIGTGKYWHTPAVVSETGKYRCETYGVRSTNTGVKHVRSGVQILV